MATHDRELPGEHYDGDHLNYEEVRELESMAVAEDGEPFPQGEFRDEVFRFANRDGASGCGVRGMQETGQGAALAYPWRV